MWPMLLNMTRDDCRRTLRSLELEAYSKMISVFRAQGELEGVRRRLLDELRGVLHISNDRHSAEARRVANDELLATIAEQLVGPNSGQSWSFEGKRRIPLMPRGIPQTIYTEIADKAAEAAAAENKEILKKREEKLVTLKTNEEVPHEAKGETAESAISSTDNFDESMYPPLVIEDQSFKIWETEICRKRKVLPEEEEGAVLEGDNAPPVKSYRNIPVNTTQKHLNLSQLYSKYSQPAISKSSGQSKHSYNQVSKVSTSKSNQTSTEKQTKRRTHKKNTTQTKAQLKKAQQMTLSPSKQYNKSPMHAEYTVPPGSFQASYAQSLLGCKPKNEYLDEIKHKSLSSPSMMTDSPTMQLLTQPATVPHELNVSEVAHPDDAASLQVKPTPTRQISAKPCHFIITKKGECNPDMKVQMSEIKILQKSSETIKVLSNRQVLVNPTSTQKALHTPSKMAPSKVLGTIPKSQNAAMLTEKIIVVSKPSENKSISNSKIFVSNTTISASSSKDAVIVSNSNISPKISETIMGKGIPATDLKVSAKTFLLNPKSGKKMLVLPAKPKTTKTTVDGQKVPLLHFKSVPTTMKFVPVSSQPSVQVVKSSPVTVTSKPSILNALPSPSPKVVSIEPIKTANMADIVPVKGLTPISALSKPSNPIVRPATGKSNVIVLQKGGTLGKNLSLAKNGSDGSKIIMGKNVNQLLQASNLHKQDQLVGTGASNVILLELNNDQTARTTTISEILERRVPTTSADDDIEEKVIHEEITEDTPVLFDNQIPVEQTCNTSSLDSAPSSIEITPMEVTEMIIDKDKNTKIDSECAKVTPTSITDWEMELEETVSRKDKDDDKLNSLHLDLGMSSDSENDFMGERHKTKSKHSPRESIQQSATSGDNSGIYGAPVGLTLAGRTLLSQLQDEGSSSNDSSFALNKSKLGLLDKVKVMYNKGEVGDKLECDDLTKAKEKLKEKVNEATSQQKRIDIYSTAITTSDITLDSFSYLEESMMAGDEIFVHDSDGKTVKDSSKDPSLDIQLSQFLEGATSTDTQNKCE